MATKITRSAASRAASAYSGWWTDLGLNELSAVDAIQVSGDILFLTEQARIAQAIRKTRLPAMFASREYHEQDVLMSYGPSIIEAARRMATYVDRILKGARPGELPIEQVSKYELILNLRVARAQGIKLPRSLLMRADEVIR